MAAGYIYVLVNSSLPALVKVGKTTRLPSERAKELSDATGVPTPFVVAFEERFDDCDSAEDAVHSELGARGFREAQNREFFRATPNEVIRIIMDLASRSPATSTTFERRGDAKTPPWVDILQQANDLLEGAGNELQDTGEALRLYKLAARMGSPEACKALGDTYFYGHDVPQDHEEALLWYKEAAKRGEYPCYLMMARVFLRHNHQENAIKCFGKFFEAHRKSLDGLHSDRNRYSHDVEQYLHICLENDIPIGFLDYINETRAIILSRVEPRLRDKLSMTERIELMRVRDMLQRTFQPDACAPDENPAESPSVLLTSTRQAFLTHTRQVPPKPGFFARLFSGG